MIQNEVEKLIDKVTGESAKIVSLNSASGGCINHAQIVRLADGRKFFAKSNSGCPDDMFIREAAGLSAMAATNTISVPQVIGCGASGRTKFLVLECIESARKQADFVQSFGRQLAQMHRQGASQQFGFEHNNYIGSTLQLNSWGENWCEFWREQRLGFQLKLAHKNGFKDSSFVTGLETLMNRLDQFLNEVEPPALIHGDLWSGNFMVGNAGQPVLIDPAVYFAHREAEFGMTTLFGGFGQEFYNSYEEVWPLESGAEDRIAIYRLYHMLNHLNLFGHSYMSGCMEIINKYC